MTLIRLIFLAAALLASGVLQAQESRIALVIGNSDYSSGPLPNPANDAKLVGDALTALGFDVIARRNADQVTMKRAIQEFGSRLEKAGPAAVGLFYYAGHGMQLSGRNYLIPTTARIEREGDVEIEAVRAVLRSGLLAEACPYLREGQRVRIKNGSLHGVEGILVKKKGQYRVVVSVTMLQRSISIEIDGDRLVAA